ncbi:MAG: hypothetical protein Q9170_000361 [Blastenia crenularia]
MPSSRRKASFRSIYYFDCECEYCQSALTCGLPDLPDALRSKLSLDKVSDLETEGMRLYSLADQASPVERTKLLDQALGLFRPYKDVYPLWRYPWPMIRHTMTSAQMALGDWCQAFGHALKRYFFIDPILYTTAWDPLRVMGTFLLARIMIELEYNRSHGIGKSMDELDKSHISWPVAISGLIAEVQAAIPKGFGLDSRFARELEQQRQGLALEDGRWKPFWGKERAELERLAHELVE